MKNKPFLAILFIQFSASVISLAMCTEPNYTFNIGDTSNKSLIPVYCKKDNNVADIAPWLEVLERDERFVIIAASKARQAVEYILKVPEANEKPE